MKPHDAHAEPFDRAGAEITRRALLGRAAVAAGGILSLDALVARPAGAARWPPTSAYSGEVPEAFFTLSLDLVRTTPGYSPPVASRAFGYAGVALYEAVVSGMPGHSSFAGRLNDLTLPPVPRNRAIHWPTVATTALASILRSLFPTAPPDQLAALDALERRFLHEARSTLPRDVFVRSAERGRVVSAHIFEWSKPDGGHEGFRNNFPPYDPPKGPQYWVPTPPGFLPALQAYWSKNRPLLLHSGRNCAAGPPLRYSEKPSSHFYREGVEVYDTVNNLSPEQREIALFWSDDPGQTPTPPGHWISILSQVSPLLELTLDRTAEAYAKVGIAVADSFVSCWHTKFRDVLLRPVTYIQRLIDEDWLPIIVTPPFPEYTSGHSVQSAASATVLTDLLGEVAFTDHTHDRRGFPPRSFSSFTEAAEEAAVSRLYGGIHYRAACERGLKQGHRVGKRVAAL